MSSKKKQAIFLFILSITVFPTVACVVAGSFGVFRWILSGAPMIPQDCMGDSIFLAGAVTDSEGQPIENAHVHARSGTRNYSASFDIEMLTDNEGHFIYSEFIPAFECDQIEYEVQADGFVTQTQTFENHRMPSSNELVFTLERTP